MAADESPSDFASHDRRTRIGEFAPLSERIDQYLVRAQGGHVKSGIAPAAGSVMLSSNDYLSLSNDPRIVEAQIAALREGGNDVFMSAVYLHDGSLQRRFEAEMAAFLKAEDTLLCQSGWCANDGLVQALADPLTPIYVDIFAHMSFWQGAQSAAVKARPFRHNNAENLRALIAKHGPGLVLVDSVYSTSGDICPLADFVAVAEETGSVLIVDESHSVGVFGTQGEGLAVALGLEHRIDYRTFSMSKAFVGRAGIVAGPARVLDFVRYESRPAIFSSAVLPHEIAGFQATLAAIRGAGDRRTRLVAATEALRGRLVDLGYDLGPSETQILPLVGGPEVNSKRLRDALERYGIIGAVFCVPATPKNRSLVRLSVHSSLTDAEIDRVADALARIPSELDMQGWPLLRPRRGGQVHIAAA